MKLLMQSGNVFQTMLALNFCLMSATEIKGMNTAQSSSWIVKTVKRTYNLDSFRSSSKSTFIPYDLKTKTIDGNALGSKIFEGLTPQEISASMVVRNYPYEGVVLSKSEIQGNSARPFSLQEIEEMTHLEVVVFLNKIK